MSMRQVVLDTETTGLEVNKGHRVIEIGCVELLQRRPTGRVFHRYLNPQREIDAGAQNVHGLSSEFLADKPRFSEIASELLEFIIGAELIIHNAAFDVAFLNNELTLADTNYGSIAQHACVLDTLLMARQKYPGQKNNLDALCKRLNVDNSRRDLHGALLDAQLLAEVYLSMTAGQGDLGFSVSTLPVRALTASDVTMRPLVHIQRANADEFMAHEQRLAAIDLASKGRCVWRR